VTDHCCHRWPFPTPLLCRRRRHRWCYLRLALVPPVQRFQIVVGGGFGFFVVEGAGGVDDVFDEEVEADFGFAEGAVVFGLAGDGRAILFGTAVGFRGRSSVSSLDWKSLPAPTGRAGARGLWRGELAVQVGAEGEDAGALVRAFRVRKSTVSTSVVAWSPASDATQP
jgi:hypothetical protein